MPTVPSSASPTASGVVPRYSWMMGAMKRPSTTENTANRPPASTWFFDRAVAWTAKMSPSATIKKIHGLTLMAMMPVRYRETPPVVSASDRASQARTRLSSERSTWT